MISMRGSRTQRRNRSISQPTPMPHKISLTMMAANTLAAWPSENAVVLTAATANR
jgi:hypothetical protein